MKELIRRLQNTDQNLIFTTIILLLFGLIMIYSSSGIEKSFYYFQKQFIWSVIGIICFLFFLRLDYNNLRSWIKWLMLISFILLILVLIFSKKVYGAKRWLFIGQPSELAKFSLILFWADYLDRRKSRLQYFWKGLIPPLFITIVYIGSIIVEPDIGIPIIIVSVIFILLYVSGVKIRHLILISSISLIVFFLCILYKPYRIQRIFAFLDPWKYKEGVGYQIIQSLLSLGSGGFIGKGLGQSELKKFYLPGQHTDFIFSIIGEELGIIGTLFIVLVFTYFLYTGFKIAKDAPDLFSKLLALGLTLSIVLQAYFNIAVCCSCLPPKGISLPFISYGGSSLVITLISIGILANISLKSRKTIKRKRI